MNVTQVIDKYAARLLMVSFFLPGQWGVWVTMAASIYYVASSLARKEYPAIVNVQWILALSCTYLALLVALPLTPAAFRPEVLKLLETRAALLAIPLVFSLLSQRSLAAIRAQVGWFAAGTVAVCMLANLRLAYAYYVARAIPKLGHEEYRIIFEQYCGVHPTYMGMYLCFALCIWLLLPPASSSLLRILRVAGMYLALVCMLALMPKTAVIATGVVLLHYGFTNRRQLYRYKWALLGMVAVVVIAVVYIPFISQRAAEIFSFFGKGKVTSTVNNSVHIRKLIWDVDRQLLDRYWLTGAGPGRVMHLLRERYFFYCLSNNFFVGYYDPHSQYFSDWLSFGLAGIAMLLFVLGTHLVKAIRRHDTLYLYLMLLVVISLFTETVFSRQQGVLFFTIFASLFFFYRKPAGSAIRG